MATLVAMMGLMSTLEALRMTETRWVVVEEEGGEGSPFISGLEGVTLPGLGYAEGSGSAECDGRGERREWYRQGERRRGAKRMRTVSYTLAARPWRWPSLLSGVSPSDSGGPPTRRGTSRFNHHPLLVEEERIAYRREVKEERNVCVCKFCGGGERVRERRSDGIGLPENDSLCEKCELYVRALVGQPR